jgi:hypothetical protein
MQLTRVQEFASQESKEFEDSGDSSMTQEEIRGAVARGWCHDKNAHKVMDTDLALAISEEVEKLLYEPSENYDVAFD